MLRRVAFVTVAASAFAFALGSGACSHSDPLNLSPEDASTNSFTSPDSAVATEPEAGLATYCVASECPLPLTTCPTSNSPCDVNLASDTSNCGSCGFACPSIGPLGSYACINGTCVLACSKSIIWTQDCNGVVDDQCEVQLGTNDDCNGCGDKCADPAKPCIFNNSSGEGHCGCPEGTAYCGPTPPTSILDSYACTDLQSSDNSCGACNVVCDPEGNGAPQYPHMHYGCEQGTCGHLRCDPYYDDCDGDRANGCEVSLLDASSCGACAKACDPGQSCVKDYNGNPICACPAGLTFCPDTGRCLDTTTDLKNCGACGVDCLRPSLARNGTGFCNYGVCDFSCGEGF